MIVCPEINEFEKHYQPMTANTRPSDGAPVANTISIRTCTKQASDWLPNRRDTRQRTGFSSIIPVDWIRRRSSEDETVCVNMHSKMMRETLAGARLGANRRAEVVFCFLHRD